MAARDRSRRRGRGSRGATAVRNSPRSCRDRFRRGSLAAHHAASDWAALLIPYRAASLTRNAPSWTFDRGATRMTSLLSCRRVPAPLALLVLACFASGPAAAQMNGTYGADRGACDRSALQSILSPTKGNIIGSLGGAALGGIVGNQFGGGGGKGLLTAVGVVGGALAGGYVGRQMDPADHACVGRTLESTPTGQTVAWHDQKKDSRYGVTPTGNFQGSNGEACRNFTT